ncbi:helicase [Streptomyces sp. BE20]|uniref:DEAD/DEAH box helicase family protein n=1 Tax=Streptomyces sp. BE20 TaxID=3002525 RepID=UPI002E7A4C8B|nr:DEAD/DEAH box helicase family protein [Streptomyces sp. BE20]MEE1823757.1 helicase [Streptomyces sp. BE20]
MVSRTWALMPDAPAYPGVRADRTWGVRVFVGQRLPGALAAYEALPHTWERFAQDRLNGAPLVPEARRPASRARLHHYQVPRVDGIAAAHRDGAPGYLLVAPTGSGKTVITVSALASLPAKSVLVVTKLGIVPAWLRTIDDYGGERRWVVVNAERLWRLFTHPRAVLADLAPDRAAELAADDGTPHVPFDVVVVDESQILANPESMRSRLVDRLVRPDRGRRPFFLPASATPFSDLSETAYAADLLAHAADVQGPAERTGPVYLDWVTSLQVPGTDGPGRPVSDIDTVKELLYRRGVGSSATTGELGLPAQQRTLRPVHLTDAERARYELAWAEFLRVVDPHDGPGPDPEDAVDEGVLRQIMRASLIKAPYVARHVADLVAAGHQVVVPAWYLRTVRALAAHIARELAARSLPDRVVEITGDQSGVRELKRAAFQTGRALVVVTNITDGISLHAGERNADGRGTRATLAPRRTVIGDVFTGGKRFVQVEGRAQRDGQQAPVDYLVAEGTKEEEWMARTLRAASRTQYLAHAPEDAEALLRLAVELEAGEPEPGPARYRTAAGAGGRR